VLAQFDAAIVARIEAAQAAGELARGRAARVIGQVITSGMLVLSISARAGTSRRSLQALAWELTTSVVAA
jgi:hypothetical protein